MYRKCTECRRRCHFSAPFFAPGARRPRRRRSDPSCGTLVRYISITPAAAARPPLKRLTNRRGDADDCEREIVTRPARAQEVEHCSAPNLA